MGSRTIGRANELKRIWGNNPENTFLNCFLLLKQVREKEKANYFNDTDQQADYVH